MATFSQFIQANRQTGSTTSLAEAAIAHDAYLVVPKHAMRQSVLRRFPALRRDQVITMGELKMGILPAVSSKQVFVDPACLYGMN